MKIELTFDGIVQFEKEICSLSPIPPEPDPLPGPDPSPTPDDPKPPIPPGEKLSWDLKNYQVSGFAGLKKIYIITVPPGKTYGSYFITSVDPSTSFRYKFTPPHGLKYLGRSEIEGSIFYGILELPFIPSYFKPVASDGFIPAGDSVLEINFIDNGRILISTSIY